MNRTYIDGRFQEQDFLLKKLKESKKKETASTLEFQKAINDLKKKINDEDVTEDTLTEIYRQYINTTNELEKYRKMLTECAGAKDTKIVKQNSTYQNQIAELERENKNIKEIIKQNEEKQIAALNVIQKVINDEFNITIKYDGTPVEINKKSFKDTQIEAYSSIENQTTRIKESVDGIEKILQEFAERLSKCASKASIELMDQSFEGLKATLNDKLEAKDMERIEEPIKEKLKKLETRIEAIEGMNTNKENVEADTKDIVPVENVNMPVVNRPITETPEEKVTTETKKQEEKKKPSAPKLPRVSINEEVKKDIIKYD